MEVIYALDLMILLESPPTSRIDRIIYVTRWRYRIRWIQLVSRMLRLSIGLPRPIAYTISPRPYRPLFL
jgi:hypothetical protein